jgi:hypothetical protein
MIPPASAQLMATSRRKLILAIAAAPIKMRRFCCFKNVDGDSHQRAETTHLTFDETTAVCSARS